MYSSRLRIVPGPLNSLITNVCIQVLLSLIWTAISFIIRYSKGAYHPGVDVGLELCSWLLVVGTVWYLIFWIYAIGYYSNVSCSAPHREDCTHARGAVLLASEIIAALSILVFG